MRGRGPSRLEISDGRTTMTVIGADAETMDVHQKRAVGFRVELPHADEAEARRQGRLLAEWLLEQRQRKAG